ncbi:MAG: efflux RND transporter periplasmic adaptor subunit [Nitrospirae bacterium]|nr:efflux RND transporter periplasmic adaptor subunit [Nitrospirota bacterium]
MIRIKRFLYAIIFLLIVGLIVYLYSHKTPVEVRVIKVRRGMVERTITGVSSGTVDPLKRVRLQALLPVRIKEVNFKEGERVKKGDVIIQLDDSEIRIKLDLQRAARRGAELRLHETEERYRFAAQNYARTKRLFEEGVVPDNVLDEVKTQYTTIGKGYEIAKNAIHEASLSVQLAEEELEKTHIRATFDGLISFLDATVGEMPAYTGLEGTTLTPQSTVSSLETKPFCEVIDDSVLKVKVPFDEVDAVKIRPGQSTKITSDTMPDQVFIGQVAYVSPVVSKTLEQNRTVDVEVDIDKTDKGRLPVGASVDAEIILETEKDVLIVPTNVVIEKEGKKFVYVVEGDVLKKRMITSGISNWEFTRVLNGLKEGERVITSLDVEGIQEGLRVRIRDEQ